MPQRVFLFVRGDKRRLHLRRSAVFTLMFFSLFAISAAAQMRGTGRLQGNVFDKNSGAPVEGATITVALPGGSTRPIVTKSDRKGHWAALGMTSGQWNVDISAPGYVTSRGTASVSEVTSAPAIRTELEPEAKPEPAPAAVAAPAGPAISREAVEAIKEGQELLRIAAGEVVTNPPATTAGAATAGSHAITPAEVKENAQRAVADFEKALPMIPEDKPELRDVKNQVLAVLAQAYYKAGNTKDAIATFEKLESLDPSTATPDAAHTTRNVLLANLYLENKQLAEAKALLEKLPPGAVTDPTVYINFGILFMNNTKPADAITYFTKAIDMNVKAPDGYYYRGLAEVQSNKYAAAKADLQRVLVLAPDSPEAGEAKQILASLK